MRPTAGRDMLAGMLEDLLRTHCPPEYVRRASADGGRKLWGKFDELGLTLASVPERIGGTGGDADDDVEILLAAGRHAVPLPLVETGFVGAHVLAASGLPVPAGPLALALSSNLDLQVTETADQYVLVGTIRDVAFARDAAAIVIVHETSAGGALVGTLAPSGVAIEPAVNLAGEPRDHLHLKRLELTRANLAHSPQSFTAIRARAAFGRALMMTGAMRAVLRIAVEHAQQRSQFGRPIAGFQAVQGLLALIAEDVALAEAAVGAGAAGSERWDGLALVQAAAAKVVCSAVATRIAHRSHQVMGAIGVTLEHPLHLFTNRLLSWRDDYGSEVNWSSTVGRLAIEHTDGIWDLVTATTTDPRPQELAMREDG